MEAVLTYVREKGGGRYNEWYFGISKDPKKSLFEEKKVDKQKDLWYLDFATDNANATAVEQKLLMLGFDGASMRTDPKSAGIYIYKKKRHNL